MVRLYKKGWSRDYLVHRLVAETFVDNFNNFPIVNHKDGNKLNNYFLNLEWTTESENQRHAIRLGLKKVHRGEKHGCSKLNNETVLFIRSEYQRGISMQQLARKFDLNYSTINRVIKRESWTHIQEEKWKLS